MSKLGGGIGAFGGVCTLALALFGCASGAKQPQEEQPIPTPVLEPVATFRDGTRLKAVYQEVDGAPPALVTWYDNELGVDCDFIDVGLPDRLVCFPTNPQQVTSEGGLFADSECQESLADFSAGCERTRLVVRWPDVGSPCGATPQLFELGEAVEYEEDKFFWRDSDSGACRVDYSPGHRAPHEFHRLGPELPIDALVSGVYQHAGGPGRIVPVTIVASDGALQLAGLGGLQRGAPSVAWDNDRQELVSTQLAAGHWYPKADYEIFRFSDAACTEPVAIGSSCRGIDAARETFVRDTNACRVSEPSQFFELGAPLSEPHAPYYWEYDECREAPEPLEPIATSDTRFGVFAVGAPVPTSAFALEEHLLTGSGQVQLVREGTTDGAPTSLVGFFDTLHGEPCTAGEAADGRDRCLPAAEAANLFADPDCSRLVLGPKGPQDDCTPAPTWASLTDFESGEVDGCYSPHYHQHLYPVEGEYQGPLYALLNGACSEQYSTGLLPGVTFLATGPETPAEKFAEVRLVRPE